MNRILGSIIVGVSDWVLSTRFYRDVLGAEVTDLGAGRVAYRFSDGTGISVCFRDPDGNLLELISYSQ
jgi:catechol 2,3-dioxygenase-like lactoylglutathione lyase family enzyme